MAPRKFVDKLSLSYERHFGEKPKQNYGSPLEKGDHPELDISDILSVDQVKIYQSLISSLQWAVSIGCLDITTAVMTMSGFRVEPRVGHLEREKHICGYLMRFRNTTICFYTKEPDFSELPSQEFDWMYSVYGNIQELIPTDIPESLGI